jgi:hypothetical protein
MGAMGGREGGEQQTIGLNILEDVSDDLDVIRMDPPISSLHQEEVRHGMACEGSN